MLRGVRTIKNPLEKVFGGDHSRFQAFSIFKYIGPGLLVTIGFIDPGNWATDLAAGSSYGLKLLWVVTLSTIMLILLQHNAAHLGIATGYCLSESATVHLKPRSSITILSTAMIASVSTAMAEILGGAIALNMLLKLPLKIGALLTTGLVVYMLFTNSYKKLEKWIIGFVSIIGLSFLYELSIVNVDWGQAAAGWFTPSVPEGSLPIIMGVLGAVVMPHNLFLHSEIIQSRQWNLKDEGTIRRQLRYEFFDTFFSMVIGWAINSAIIIVAAATFYKSGMQVSEIGQAHQMLRPILGNAASVIFALALLFSAISSIMTAGMTGGSIFAGFYKEPYNIEDPHTKVGVLGTLIAAMLVVFVVGDPFKGLIYSQILLSMQLPFTIFLQIYLTSSKKVMGKYANSWLNKAALLLIGLAVTVLNIILLISFFK